VRTATRRAIATAVGAATLAFGLVAHEGAPKRTSPDAVAARAYLALPLAFEPNVGQAAPAITHLARGAGHVLALTPGAAIWSIARAQAPSATIRLEWLGANPTPAIETGDALAGRVNHLLGADPTRWRTNVPTYARVTYRGIYPGVDLVFHGSAQRLEYDFVLAPGVAPETLRLRVAGTESRSLDAHGDLHLRSGSLAWIQRRPESHQEVDGRRVAVESRFVLRDGDEIGFAVAKHDPTRPLVIDPVLRWSTHLGGSGEDGVAGNVLGEAIAIAVDASGSAVVAGETQSTDFPTTGEPQPVPGGGLDAFVAKLTPNGLGLVYSTYFGGSDDDAAHAVAIDPNGNTVLAGVTRSVDFPVAAAEQPNAGGGADAFVAKLSPIGAPLFATFAGGAGDDAANALAIDPLGGIHVAGATRSIDFPTRAPLQPTARGGGDAFVARYGAAGALELATYLGGAGEDVAHAIALAGESIYLAGVTRSPDFPIAAPVQPRMRGASDAFVSRIAASGSTLLFSTYLGGSDDETARALVATASGLAIVAGETNSNDFPIEQPLQAANAGGRDAFAAGVGAGGIAFSTYLGGGGDDGATGLAASDGSIFLGGTTASADFPTVAPVQAANAGITDAWIARLDAGGTALGFSTYFGGEQNDSALALALAGGSRLLLAGYTNSRLFPTHHALKDDLGVGSDAFVTAFEVPSFAIAYSTYLGGSAEEASALIGQAIAVDASGHAHLTGPTQSLDFPIAGAFAPALSGASDAYVAKLTPDGAALVYATYLGGGGDDAGLGIAVGPDGRAHLTGRTNSTDFPTTPGAFQPALAGGADAFVASLTPDGDDLVHASYLGGSGSDLARAIAVDARGAAVIAGATRSADFPVRNAFQPALAGGIDAFVTRVAPAGDALEWSTYLGGGDDENPANTTWGVAIDAAGAVVVVGTTSSSDFPLVQPVMTYRGSRDAFVAKLAASGSTLLFSTLLGGSGGDTARDVAVDAFGRIYVVGATRSPTFPVVAAIQPVHHGEPWYDAFVARIRPGAGAGTLEVSTFLGGALLDGALAVDLDRAGNVHVAGQTSSPDFPIVGNGASAGGGGDDAFLVVLPREMNRIGYATRIGGGSGDVALGLATDAAGTAYLTGVTDSPDFPSVAPLQSAGGGPDAFAAAVALGPGAFACEIETDRSSYAFGQVVRVARLRFANAGTLPLPGLLRVTLDVPQIGVVELLRSDVILPTALDATLGPFPLFGVDAGKPPGAWTIACSIEDPAIGVPIARQTAAFTIP